MTEMPWVYRDRRGYRVDVVEDASWQIATALLMAKEFGWWSIAILAGTYVIAAVIKTLSRRLP